MIQKISEKYDNLRKKYYDWIYTQPENKKIKKWKTGSEYVDKVKSARAFRDNMTVYKAALGVDAAGDYGVLSNKEAIEALGSEDISSRVKTFFDSSIKDAANPGTKYFADTPEKVKSTIKSLATARDSIIKDAYQESKNNLKEARRLFLNTTNQLYYNKDNPSITFDKDFGGVKNRKELLNEFRNISKDIKGKELDEEYEKIIRRHFKGGEIAENTSFHDWGEKISNIANNDEVKASLDEIDKQKKNVSAFQPARSKILKREEYNKRPDITENQYRRGINYKALNWSDEELNNHRKKVNQVAKEIREGKGASFGKGKVAMAVMGLAGLAGVTSLMFSGGRQQNSNLYNANQAMY